MGMTLGLRSEERMILLVLCLQKPQTPRDPIQVFPPHPLHVVLRTKPFSPQHSDTLALEKASKAPAKALVCVYMPMRPMLF